MANNMEMKDILALSLKDVPLLSVRTINVLKRDGIETLGDLVSKNHSDLLRIRDLGRRSLNEIEVALENLGFQYSPINNQSLMTNKPTKPIKVVPPATPTKEELELKRIAYFAQRREGIAVHILGSLLQNNPGVNGEDVIIKAVDLTDKLLEKLYPKPEDKK